MSKNDEHRLSGISNGALVARMAGSIALAIGVSAGVLEFAPDLGPRSSFALRSAGAFAVSAVVILAIVRWINRRSHRHVSRSVTNADTTSESS